MEKLIVKSLDEEYDEIIKGRGPDRKPRRKKGTSQDEQDRRTENLWRIHRGYKPKRTEGEKKRWNEKLKKLPQLDTDRLFRTHEITHKSIDEIQAEVIEKGRGPDKKKRKSKVGVKSTNKYDFTDRYGHWEGKSRVVGVKKNKKEINYKGPKNMSPGEQKEFDDYVKQNKKKLDRHFKAKS